MRIREILKNQSQLSIGWKTIVNEMRRYTLNTHTVSRRLLFQI